MMSMRNFRNLQSDDIGDLRGKNKTSEMTAEVRCHNHAYQVALQKQLDHWYKEQTVAVNNLSRMQQASFQNLIKVQNEKRKIQRQNRIKRQKEFQQRLREQATKDREEAMRRSLELSLSIKRQTQRKKRTIRTKFQSIDSLSEIQEETKNDEEDEEFTKDRWDSAVDLTSSLPSQSESGIGSSIASLRPNSRSLSLTVTTAPNPFVNREESAIDAVFLENSVSPEINKFPANQLDLHKVTVLPDIERPKFKTKAQSSNGETTQSDIKTVKVLPPINPLDSQQPKSSDNTESKTSSSKIKDSVKERQARIELIKDMQKYHIGIANRRFKIPEYDIPQVSSVKKYSKTSEGSFQSTEVTVRPAVEDFKLPSRKPDYLIAKALVWEKGKEAERERKVRHFVSQQKEFEENNTRKSSDEDRSSATPELPQNGYNRSRRQSTYITLNDSIHHKALLGVVGDKDDLRNCRYLRVRDSFDCAENVNDGKPSRKMSSMKRERREKLSSWGKLSSVRAPPHQNGQYYYVSLL